MLHKIEVVREESYTKYGDQANSPQRVVEFLKNKIGNSVREQFVVLHLDIQHQVISYEQVSVGTVASSIVHPREVFLGAILSSATAIIACHNHPSGSLEPSVEDINVTKRLAEAGKILGIPLVDHIIVTDNGHKSLREHI